MGELPFTWISHKGERPPLGTDDGRDRGAPGFPFRGGRCGPAMRWIKAGPRPTLPINPASHLGTCVTEAGNRAGAPTPCRRLLHTSDRIRSDERGAFSRRIGHSCPYGMSAAVELCRTPARGDLVEHSMCRFPEAGIPLLIVDTVWRCGHEGCRVRLRRAVARSAQERPPLGTGHRNRSARTGAESDAPPRRPSRAESRRPRRPSPTRGGRSPLDPVGRGSCPIQRCAKEVGKRD